MPRNIDNQVFNSSGFDNKEWFLFLDTIIPSVTLNEFHDIRKIVHKRQSFWFFFAKVLFFKIIRMKVIHEIDSPQVITNKYPRLFENSFDINKIGQFRRLPNQKDSIVVFHIRQGELALSQFQSRYLPLTYFEKIAAEIMHVHENLRIDFKLLVPVEPGQNSLISINDPKIRKSMEIDPFNKRVIKVNDDYVRIENEKPTIKSTPILFGANWLEPREPWNDFVEMISSDILVMSKSSFSYLCALLNPNAIIIYTPFWHPPLKNWLVYRSDDTWLVEFRKELSQRIGTFVEKKVKDLIHVIIAIDLIF